ncbi:PAP2 family protein [Alicyclobacillaceae bacterium I2511]|jgi:undecaprenyl-diphosphatase|nr:PAP2 family protein [Alicyclobacillaceae bacterium I2511]
MELHFPDSLDERITHRCMQYWDTHPMFNAWMTVVARWTPVHMVGLIVLVAVDILPSTVCSSCLRGTAFAAIAGAVMGRIVNEPLSRWVRRPRPFEFLSVSPLLVHKGGDAFPSNHSTGAFALAFGCMHIPGYFQVLLGMAVLLSVSRVYTGLHHFSDVMAGVLHGILMGSVAVWLVTIWHICG